MPADYLPEYRPWESESNHHSYWGESLEKKYERIFKIPDPTPLTDAEIAEIIGVYGLKTIGQKHLGDPKKRSRLPSGIIFERLEVFKNADGEIDPSIGFSPNGIGLSGRYESHRTITYLRRVSFLLPSR